MYEKKNLTVKKNMGIAVAVLAIIGALLRVYIFVTQNYFAWLRTAFSDYGYPQEKIIVVSLILSGLVAIAGFVTLAVAAFRKMPLFVPYILLTANGVIPFLRVLLIGGSIDFLSFLVQIPLIVGGALAIAACCGAFSLRYVAMGVLFVQGLVELVAEFVWMGGYSLHIRIVSIVLVILISAVAHGLAMLFSAPETAGRPPVPPYGYAPYGQPMPYGQPAPYGQPMPYGQPTPYGQPMQYQQPQYQQPVQPTVPQAPAVPQPPAEE